jgi:RNA polymerase sigma-70 factor (sigma-E family)
MDLDEDFRAYVAHRSSALLRTGYLLTGDAAAAEDLVQSALVKTWGHWRRVSAMGNPDAYVRRVMLNERRSWWRRIGAREQLVEVPPERPGSDEAAAHAERDRVWRAMTRMPPRMRAVLVLRYWDDLSEIEIADTLGCSIGTVKSQASRGLRRLADLLEGDRPEAAHKDQGAHR